jgi:hypothetical protein
MQKPIHNLIRTMRILGALALLAVGAVHLQQYLGAGYRMIPTIGPLFLLNAIGSAIVGLALVLPLERRLPGRIGNGAVAALATAAVLIALGSLIALFVSESGSLFGFSESGYRTAIVIAIVAEAATIVLLVPVAVWFARALSRGRQPTTRSTGEGRYRVGRPGTA